MKFESAIWRLDGKRALVSGASRGIGYAIALQLAERGAEVAILSRSTEDIKKVEQSLREKDFKVHGFQADVTKIEDTKRVLGELEAKWGSLDILVNNAGTNIRKRVLEYSSEEYSKIFQTNVDSVFEYCRLAFPLLEKAKQSSIVNILSVAGFTHLRTGAPYAMSKAALVQLTRNLAAEWAAAGIRVNSVAPWYTRTKLVEPVLSNPDFFNDVIARTPLKRIAEPEEVAAVATFLSLPAASYVTGQSIAVDGGFLINGF